MLQSLTIVFNSLLSFKVHLIWLSVCSIGVWNCGETELLNVHKLANIITTEGALDVGNNKGNDEYRSVICAMK